jgi:hypothetical protein
MPTHKEIVAELIVVLNSDEACEARAGAAKGLGVAGGTEAVAALRNAMKTDKAGLVRGACATALGAIIGRGNLQDMIDQ